MNEKTYLLNKKVYLASGWWDEQSIQWLDKQEAKMDRLKINYFSPRKLEINKLGEVKTLSETLSNTFLNKEKDLKSDEFISKTIYLKDMEELEKCDVMFANISAEDIGVGYEIGAFVYQTLYEKSKNSEFKINLESRLIIENGDDKTNWTERILKLLFKLDDQIRDLKPKWNALSQVSLDLDDNSYTYHMDDDETLTQIEKFIKLGFLSYGGKIDRFISDKNYDNLMITSSIPQYNKKLERVYYFNKKQ